MSQRLTILVQILDDGMQAPTYEHPGDAGLDLSTTIDITLAPGQRQVVPTGIAVALPAEHVGFVVPRSGLAARSGVSLVNAPGTIDAGYRGEIKVVLVNHDPADSVSLRRGDRIAQLVVMPVSSVHCTVVDSLPDSSRGVGGLGSTGGIADWDATHGKDR